jgi:two-component system sensor histidine kinase PilS (NtrC family)
VERTREEGAAAGRLGRRREDRERRWLIRLLAGRLVLSVGVLALALALVGVREGAEDAERGLYGTVAAAFLATALSGLCFQWVRNAGRFGAVQVATDVLLISSLVTFSGGPDSPFTFLYVPVIVYAARLFGRPGAYGCAAGASAAYGALLVAIESGWLPTWPEAGGAPRLPALALFGLHSGAWLLVAFLASALSRDLHRAGRELERRKTDLGRLRQLHARTVECLTSGLLTTDGEGRVTSFNPEAERITGIPARSALGRPLGEILPGVPGEIEQLSSSTTGRPRVRTRLGFVRAGGDELHLGVAASRLRDAEGAPIGHVVIFQDVTEVVRMEAELRRSERLAAVGELAAGMAHEVRNPLAAISGSIQMLRGAAGRGEEDAEGRRLMDIVLRETDRLDALIAEFLRFARPAPPKPTQVPLEQVVAEVVEVFAGSCPPGIELVREVTPGLAAWVDEDQLRQLLWNLLRNAVPAMPAGGRLAVGARAAPAPQEAAARGRNATEGSRGGAGVEIEVADTGTGMPPEVLERIFEPFFTTRPSGSGLGLATVHRVVEANRGVLRVESGAGRGTRFRVWLPAAPEAP